MQFRMSYSAAHYKDAPERMCRELWIQGLFSGRWQPLPNFTA